MGLAKRGFAVAALVLAAISFAAVEAFASSATIERIHGTEASDTAAAISRQLPGSAGGAVVLARDDDYMDAMSATGLAGALDAPILLTNRFQLSSSTAAEIDRLQPSVVYIVGGTVAITPDIDAALSGSGYAVKRVYGTEACDTSVKCAKEIEAQAGANAIGTAIVATSVDFADALSVSSYAYKYALPIFIVGAQTGDPATDRKLPAEAIQMLDGYGTVFVPGGVNALPDASLDRHLGKAVRIFGTTGYETSLQVAKYLVGTGYLGTSTVGIASGDAAPKGVDALASASLCAKSNAPLLLVDKHMSGIGLAYQLLGYGDLSRVCIFGGSSVVSSDAFARVRNLLGASGNDTAPPTPPENTAVSPAELLAIAQSRVGCGYKFGATGPDYFDCSGFVYYVFNQGGYNIPRMPAEDYYYYGDPVSVNEAQAGDIVAYYLPDGSIFHVAVYAGDGMVYEAVNEYVGVAYNPVAFCDVAGAGHWFARLTPQEPSASYYLAQGLLNGQSVSFCSACWSHVGYGDWIDHLISQHG